MHRERNRGVPVRPEAGLLGAQEPPEYRQHCMYMCIFLRGEGQYLPSFFFLRAQKWLGTIVFRSN